MAKLTREQLEARRIANQQEALKSVAKTEQLNLRINAEGIERLYEMSGKLGKPVGTMVREWIMERLEQEEAGAEEPPAVALAVIQQKLSQLQRTLVPLKRPAGASRKKPAAAGARKSDKASTQTRARKRR